jgi:hypothetical protein
MGLAISVTILAATIGLTLSGAAVRPVPASAAEPCPNEQLRIENNSTALPDCRAYEQVSPSGNAEVYVPEGPIGRQEDARTGRPFRAASDGNSVAYLAEPPSSGQGGSGTVGTEGGNQYLATRAPGGWTATNVQPLSHNFATGYQGFSSNLSFGVI